jgi:HAD superfamily hydrolase (TIGR01509 family)
VKFQGVIFDVDGTLLDSNDAHAHAFVEAFREFGFEVSFQEVRRLIGKGSDKLIPELIGRYDEAVAERKSEIFKRKYLPQLRPFPGAAELLKKLRSKGLKLAVASSAAKEELDALLRIAGVDEYVQEKTSADDAEHSKPDPDIVLVAVRKLGLPPARCLMIGDTPYDAQAAQRAGVAFVGVRCGGWSDKDLQPALGVFNDPADILRAIRDIL